MSKKPIHALIDADLIQYQYSIANQNNDGSTNLGTAIEQALRAVETITNRTFAERTTLVFSGQANYRKRLNRCYKANRNGDKPILLNQLRQAMCSHYNHIIVPGLEADDILGILCTEKGLDETRVLVSYDKDMRTLPVNLYNSKTDEFSTITEVDAEIAFWTQCITGDTTDGYYGIPGMGPKGAEPLVAEIIMQNTLEEKFAVLLREYEWRYLDKEYALRQCRMAYILHHGDFKDETKEVRLWGPGPEQWYSL